MRRVSTVVLYQLVVTENVGQGQGIVNASRGFSGAGKTPFASLDCKETKKGFTHKRPAWVVIELTTGKGKGTIAKVQPFQEESVWVPACRGPAATGACTVTRWPIVVAACMTAHRVALWIPPRGFFAQGLRHTAVSRVLSLKGLFLVLPDTVVQNREEAKTFLKDALQPPLDAINALDDSRARAPATVGRDTPAEKM